LDSTGQNNTVSTYTGTYDASNKYYYCSTVQGYILNPTFATTDNWTYSETDGDFVDGHVSSNWYYMQTISSAHISSGASCQILQNIDITHIDSINFSWYTNIVNGGITLKVLFGATEIYSAGSPDGTTAVSINTTALSGTGDLIFKWTIGPGADANMTMRIGILTVVSDAFTDSIVQSEVATVPTGMTKVFVTPLMYESLAAGDNITADVSIDNGAHYTTAVPINTWTPITSANGTQLIVKMNLDTASGTTTPKVLGWAVDLE